MDASKIKYGLKVKTIGLLKDTKGIFVSPKHLEARKPNTSGTIGDYIPGHGGDVWWIIHEDGTVGAYITDEFNPA